MNARLNHEMMDARLNHEIMDARLNHEMMDARLNHEMMDASRHNTCNVLDIHVHVCFKHVLHKEH